MDVGVVWMWFEMWVRRGSGGGGVDVDVVLDVVRMWCWMCGFFFARPTLSVRSENSYGRGNREVPVFGTVPGVFLRIPHAKPLARLSGRRPGFSCGSQRRFASSGSLRMVLSTRTLLVRLVWLQAEQGQRVGQPSSNAVHTMVACSHVRSADGILLRLRSSWPTRVSITTLPGVVFSTFSARLSRMIRASPSSCCVLRPSFQHQLLRRPGTISDTSRRYTEGAFSLYFLCSSLCCVRSWSSQNHPIPRSARQHPGAFARAQAQARHGGKAPLSCLPETEHATHHVAWSEGQ